MCIRDRRRVLLLTIFGTRPCTRDHRRLIAGTSSRRGGHLSPDGVHAWRSSDAMPPHPPCYLRCWCLLVIRRRRRARFFERISPGTAHPEIYFPSETLGPSRECRAAAWRVISPVTTIQWPGNSLPPVRHWFWLIFSPGRKWPRCVEPRRTSSFHRQASSA